MRCGEGEEKCGRWREGERDGEKDGGKGERCKRGGQMKERKNGRE